jgi:large subunit ribosomal protein L17
MRHRKKKKILSRKTGPRKALLKSLARNLILHNQIKTTEAKAKALRPFVERLVKLAIKGDLAARRRAFALLGDRQMVKKLFETLGPQYKERRGGYLKIFKLGLRKGDNAPLVIIKFV